MISANLMLNDWYHFDADHLNIGIDSTEQYSIDYLEQKVTEKGYSHIAREFNMDGVKAIFTHPDMLKRITVYVFK